MLRRRAGLALLLALLPSAGLARADTPREVRRFFADCPHHPRRQVHREQSLWDAHAVLYTTANLLELEVFRLADWLIDLPLPGPPLRPFEWSINRIRNGYHRLPPSRPVARAGELVDALQLRELSLGDATAGYSLTGGGQVNPGGGTLLRVNKLIDWTQHVVD